ncbi:STE23 [Candida margitis]|uniref:STE23 n=1 Tax=Candida margitis TaxID=1775924 RepID=UPI002226E9EA|nr:STE23 [Candida margitis]KAI5958477.1 STE23 [Candida margitis]
MPQAQQYTVLADDASIEKSVIDDRQYRFLKLKNDLRVLVISDPYADKSAASLDVNVGSFADKAYDVPGLAHFCEHLLFMGTSKYPSENEYSDYLAKHSGNSNAYTAAEHTNYYFQVGSNHLEGALDRFAQFFISPLFSKSCKDREINAVDSENKKNLQNDLWRLYQLDKSNSNPSHPYNGFSTGNYVTLHTEPESQGINVRDVLMQFHRDRYSSNLMSLVILGKESLDELTSWAVEKFSTVADKALSRPNYGGELIYKSEQMLKLIKAKPVKDLHQLEISFMIPDDLEDKWDCKPQSYFSHLLGHESEGSILFYLKSKGWVTELSSGNMKVCQGSSSYVVEFQLTPEGLTHWQDIVETTFDYLDFVSKKGPQKWIWEEIKNISEVNFKFKQKTDAANTASKLSSVLYKFDEFIPAENILSSSVVRKYDPEAIKKFGSYLNPGNFRVTLVSPEFEGLSQKEKWYGTEYQVQDIPQALIASINKPTSNNSHLHFPSPNPFIPTNFDILTKKSVEHPQIAPYLVNHDNKMNLWYKQDDQFEVPKGTIEIVFHLPGSNVDVASATKSVMFAEMLDDHLNQVTYFASLVGLRVGINCWRDGFAIVVTGYNHKLPILLNKVLDEFFNFHPSVDRFGPLKFKLLKEFKNIGYQVPYNQIGSYHLQVVNEKVYDYDDKIKVLEGLQFSEVEHFIKNSITSAGVFAEILVHGNFDINNATEIKMSISKHLDSIKPIMEEYEEYKFHLRNYVLQPGEVTRFEVNLKDKNNINSCIEYYLQISPTNDDIKLRVLTDLLATIIREPCFNQLRTKEQLGYVVFSGLKKGRTSLGFRILVQSERPSEYLEYRIDEFLSKFGKYVNNELSAENFQKFKQALIDAKLQKIKHLSEETNRLWNAITDGYYDFDARQKHAALLEGISKEEFINFFNEYVTGAETNKNEKIGKFVLHLKSQVNNNVPESKLVQAALNNFGYRHGYDLSHDFVDGLVKQVDSVAIDSIIAEYIQEVERESKTSLNQEQVTEEIKSAIRNPVPDRYPSGTLVNSVDEFRKSHDIGGYPHPVSPLTKFYYDQSHL